MNLLVLSVTVDTTYRRNLYDYCHINFAGCVNEMNALNLMESLSIIYDPRQVGMDELSRVKHHDPETG